jgi:hypothetical protein
MRHPLAQTEGVILSGVAWGRTDDRSWGKRGEGSAFPFDCTTTNLGAPSMRSFIVHGWESTFVILSERSESKDPHCSHLVILSERSESKDLLLPFTPNQHESGCPTHGQFHRAWVGKPDGNQSPTASFRIDSIDAKSPPITKHTGDNACRIFVGTF